MSILLLRQYSRRCAHGIIVSSALSNALSASRLKKKIKFFNLEIVVSYFLERGFGFEEKPSVCRAKTGYRKPIFT